MLPSNTGELEGQAERYLTNIQKQIELLEFKERCTPDCDGLASLPDQNIVLYLLELNRIPGLCTLQSCSGHIEKDVRDGTDYVTNGGLWLWLSEELMQRFYATAFELRRQSGIESLRIQFQRHGREFIDISFKGGGHGKLKQSMDVILEFFQEI